MCPLNAPCFPTDGQYSALARLDAADMKTEPSMQPLTVLREVDLICHLWQRYVTMALLPLASSSVTVRREMVVFNNQAVSRIEGGANQVSQKLTDGMHSRAPRCTAWYLYSHVSRCVLALDAAREAKAN